MRQTARDRHCCASARHSCNLALQHDLLGLVGFAPEGYVGTIAVF